MSRNAEELQGVTLLGNQNTKYKYEYDPSILETFVNKNPDNDYVITFDGYEGTSLCPKTGQPDFFKMVINYIANEKCVESKSLKLYLFSFRSTGEFHEDVVNRIGKDLVQLLDPKYLEVRGIFSPRGGIAIYPFFNYAGDEKYRDLAMQRKIDTMRDACNRTVKYDM